MVKLHFVREFTKGNLVGLYHVDAIRFTDRTRAESHVDSIGRNHLSGYIDYKIIAFQIETLEEGITGPGAPTDI